MNKNILRTAAFIAVVGAVPAAASPVSLTFNGFENGSRNVNISAPVAVNPNNVSAGGFSMSDGVNSFVAWCIDLFDVIVTGPEEYTVARPSQVTDAEADNLNRLFTGYGDTATATATNSAAFQLVIWEIIYDNTLSLTSGAFQATANTDVTARANTLLSGLSGFGLGYDLTFYSDVKPTTRQDLVTGTPSPVPLPAGILLLGSGLGALAIARRRRKTA